MGFHTQVHVPARIIGENDVMRVPPCPQSTEVLTFPHWVIVHLPSLTQTIVEAHLHKTPNGPPLPIVAHQTNNL